MEGEIDYDYERVIPRDLFNEAKLLKCLGKLTLLIHDGVLPMLTLRTRYNRFIVGLHSSGYLCCYTIQIFLEAKKAVLPLDLYTTYNSKLNYPLICYDDKLGEIMVFTEQGELTEEFKDYIK